MRYCATHRIERSAFSNAVLVAALYPHARVLLPVLSRRRFALDLDFIDSVGRLTRIEDFRPVFLDFVEDPAGRTWLRDWLHLRVSARRLHRLLRATLRA